MKIKYALMDERLERDVKSGRCRVVFSYVLKSIVPRYKLSRVLSALTELHDGCLSTESFSNMTFNFILPTVVRNLERLHIGSLRPDTVKLSG